MGQNLDLFGLDRTDDPYFDEPSSVSEGGFDARLLRRSVTMLKARTPLIFRPTEPASDAMRAMQREHRGCVLITRDGTAETPLVGIFTERDVLLRIIDGGRHPSSITLDEVMTEDPEVLPQEASVAWALNKMSVGGFRHVPIVDDEGRPLFAISLGDAVQFMVDAFPTEILNLPPEYGTARYRTRDGA